MPHISTPLFNAPRKAPPPERPLWPVLRILVALLLGSLFVWAGVIKVMDPRLFQVSIESYEFDWLVSPLPAIVALVLPWLEITSGLALVLRVLGLRALYRGALLIVGCSSLAFLGAVISTCVRGLEVGCGCFGDSIQLSCPTHILLNSVMVIGSFWLLFSDSGAPKQPKGLILRT